LQSNMSFFTTN